MKSILVKSISLVALLATVSNVKAQWTAMPSISGYHLTDMSFPSEEVGFVVSNEIGQSSYQVWKTTDGANTWDTIPVPDLYQPEIHDLHFLSETLGFLSVRDNSMFGLDAQLFKTTDGGNTWTDISPMDPDIGFGYSQVYFLNENTGYWLIGESVYKTEDGGTTWIDSNPGIYSATSISFYDEDHGIIGNWDGTFAYRGALITTTDGGDNWNHHDLTAWYSKIDDVDFVSENVAMGFSAGWGAGISAPQLRVSTDAGMTWDSVAMQLLADSMDQPLNMDFANPDTGYILGGNNDGTIYYTVDGGHNWMIDHVSNNYMRALQLAGSAAYAIGQEGVVLKKEGAVLGFGESPLANAGFDVFPNPVVSGQSATLAIDKPHFVKSLVITDVLGRKLTEVAVNKMTKAAQIEIPQTESGIYFLAIDFEVGQLLQKLVVE